MKQTPWFSPSNVLFPYGYDPGYEHYVPGRRHDASRASRTPRVQTTLRPADFGLEPGVYDSEPDEDIEVFGADAPAEDDARAEADGPRRQAPRPRRRTVAVPAPARPTGDNYDATSDLWAMYDRHFRLPRRSAELRNTVLADNASKYDIFNNQRPITESDARPRGATGRRTNFETPSEYNLMNRTLTAPQIDRLAKAGDTLLFVDVHTKNTYVLMDEDAQKERGCIDQSAISHDFRTWTKAFILSHVFRTLHPDFPSSMRCAVKKGRRPGVSAAQTPFPPGEKEIVVEMLVPDTLVQQYVRDGPAPQNIIGGEDEMGSSSDDDGDYVRSILKPYRSLISAHGDGRRGSASAGPSSSSTTPASSSATPSSLAYASSPDYLQTPESGQTAQSDSPYTPQTPPTGGTPLAEDTPESDNTPPVRGAPSSEDPDDAQVYSFQRYGLATDAEQDPPAPGGASSAEPRDGPRKETLDDTQSVLYENQRAKPPLRIRLKVTDVFYYPGRAVAEATLCLA